MAHEGLKVLDSDMHCMEPADLWERYIDGPYKPFAPRGLQEYIADLRIVIDGKTMPRHSSLRPRSSADADDPFQKRRERFRKAAERGWDGRTQLEAMDTEGIDVAVVRSEEHTSELQSPCNLVCRLLLEKKKKQQELIF